MKQRGAGIPNMGNLPSGEAGGILALKSGAAATFLHAAMSLVGGAVARELEWAST